jgi:glycosyltransferase involved in cell wall biosynthesis
MKKVMVFANPYKPMKGIGTKRITNFLKNFSDLGWEAIVIAPKVKYAGNYDLSTNLKTIRVPIIGPTNLYSIARNIFPRKQNKTIQNNKALQVEQAPIQKTGRRNIFNQWLFIPDEYILWSIYAAFKAIIFAKRNKIDICFATGPSRSTFIAGVIFSKITGIRLITDFRDPWIDSEFLTYKTKFHFFINKVLEKLVVNHSSKVIVVSPSMKHMFEKRYDNLEKFKVIFNGFDKNDINLNTSSFNQLKNKHNTITITHTGTFYGEKNPESFLKALSIVKEKYPFYKIRVNFVGKIDHSYLRYSESLKIKDWIKDLGYLPYEESLQYQQESDILLLIPGPGKGTLTGKVFEYLSAKKPILCVGTPDSDLEKLIEFTDSGMFANSESPEEIANQLIKLIHNQQNNRDLFKFINIDKFEFKELSNQLTNEFKELI